MDYKIYHNCLRVQITDDDMQDERIDNIAEHCAKYGIDNVMLTINQEEFNVGHITLKQAKPWVEVLKKAAKAIREKGLTVSVNNWIEIGHCDRGRTFTKEQNFQPFVDINGKTAESVACPLCENWRAYFLDYAEMLVRELKPDTFWLEDDFRLHNHEPLEGVGCYCPLHMAYYNKKLGTNYTREQFVEKLFAKGGLNPVRKVWLEANRDVVIDLAGVITERVKSTNPDTDMAIMCSRPVWHCYESRDWNKLLDTLGNGSNKINRIHLPYGEITGKDFLYNINAMSMPIRAMASDDVVVMPEIEHGPATLYVKTPRYLRYTLEASIPLVLSGTTYSIYDFVANGARESFGFGEVISGLQPYMQGIRDLDLKFSSLKGVTVPIDQNACYKKSVENDWLDLSPVEYHAAAYLSGLGIAYNYSEKKEYKNQTIFLTASNMDYFTDEQLKNLFADNYVILDGSAVLSLSARGLLSLIEASRAERMIGDTGVFSYEEACDPDLEICGVKKIRGSARRVMGDAAKVEYTGDVKVHTKLYNHLMQESAPCFVQGNGFAVLPFMIDKYRNPLFCDIRRYFLTKAVTEQTNEYVCCDFIAVSPYLYKRDNDYVLLLENANVDTLPKAELDIGNVPFTKVMKLTRDGNLTEWKFTKNGTKLIIDDELEYLSSAVYVLK